MMKITQWMRLESRTALITGGGGYLGRAFAETLAELGANVALADVNSQAVEQTSIDIAERYGVRAHAFQVDLADSAVVALLPQKIADTLGGLDILINNAGFVGTSNLEGWVSPFEQQACSAWRAALEVNLTAPFFLTQAALPWLAASGKGSVINIASIYGFLGPDMRLYEDTAMGNPGAYAASKGGLIQTTRWLATVLAPKVRVNCVSPGGIFRNQSDKFVKRYEARTPMQRMGTEDDMKGVVAFLASDLSAYVTGQHIAIDGGFSAW